MQMMDRYLIFRFLKERCHGNQIICERQVQHSQKTGVFCQIFADILNLFSQSFHHMKTLYVQMMAFRNGLEDHNFDFSRVIGKHFCTPYRNLVRFGSVTPEFKGGLHQPHLNRHLANGHLTLSSH